MLKVLALTSIRSDYDLMSRLYSLLNSDGDVDLRLLVSGAHLSPSHGKTVDDIKSDNFQILAEVETLISSDTRASRLKTASILLSATIDLVKVFAPDVIIYAGDREDVLVAAMLGGFLGVPTVHFFGGDHASDGHIDNAVRHATSKLSSLHFVSTAEHKNRLQCLGEREDRIFVLGSVALDKFIAEPALTKDVVLQGLAAKAHAFSAPIAILIFHPVEDEIAVAGEYISRTVEALIVRGYHVMMGLPNTDPGNVKLVEALQAAAERDEVTFYKNVSRSLFVNLFRSADLIIGNSSAGLLESASIPVAAINIGERQKGRMAGGNVIFCEGDAESINAALDYAVGESFKAGLKAVKNPYGDGNSSSRAYQLLKSIDFKRFVKKAEDPLDANR